MPVQREPEEGYTENLGVQGKLVGGRKIREGRVRKCEEALQENSMILGRKLCLQSVLENTCGIFLPRMLVCFVRAMLFVIGRRN